MNRNILSLYRRESADNCNLFCLSQVILCENRQAIIDGAKCIVEYTPDSVKFDLGRVCVRICGADLSIKTLSDDKIIIDGSIMSVDFSS